jgi:hypothetical protein
LVTQRGLSASPLSPVAAAAAAASDRTGRGRREVKHEEGWRLLKGEEAADGINAVVVASLPKSKVRSAVDLKKHGTDETGRG